jgi:hypothetical protein
MRSTRRWYKSVYPFQFKLSEGSIFGMGYVHFNLVCPFGALLRKEYTVSLYFVTFRSGTGIRRITEMVRVN